MLMKLLVIRSTDLALSATTVNENVPVNTVIGTFSVQPILTDIVSIV
jgi:hypothetical protein